MLENKNFFKIEESGEKSFGYIFSIFFFLIGVYFLYLHSTFIYWLFVVSLCFLVITLFFPKILKLPNKMWIKFGILLKKEGIRDRVIKELLDDGIETRPFFWPLHLQSALPKRFVQKDLKLEVQSILYNIRKKTKLVIIANPNSPTAASTAAAPTGHI